MTGLRPAAAALLFFSTLSTLWAETPDAGRAQENLTATEQQLGAARSREQALAGDIAAMIKDQEELSARLIAAADEVALRQQALKDTGSRVTALDDEAEAIRKELHARRATLAELLAGLQRLEQDPPPALVVAPGRILDALRGAMMFGTVVPELRDEAAHLVNRLERLEAIKIESAKTRTIAEVQFAALQQSRNTIATLLEERKAALASREKDLAAERARMQGLAARVGNLRQLLAGLAEAEARKSQETRERQAEEARQRALLDHPAVRLSAAKGHLEYPVQGRILARFGENNGLGGILSGLAIAADPGSLVRAPADASVVFAGPFRSYGQLLILDAGEGYLLLMAGMKQVDVTLQQQVRAGEPLGAMGSKGAPATLVSTGVSDGRAVLYVEVRKDGEPADSNDWWIGSRKEAMQ